MDIKFKEMPRVDEFSSSWNLTREGHDLKN